ncbi:response regulator [Pseudalkalibacillus caeni]|uniref:response regulator n=1 Tax=Exobacillus caeni TaxID=2574798 RepID=UPI0014856E4F|nr:response regulator [Pseudalkalibacillus caeni]
MKNRGLIVEEQHGIRTLIGEQLQAEGFVTYNAENAYEAISLTLREEIDFIVLSLAKPFSRSFGLLKRLKSVKPDTKVMVIADSEKPEMMEEAFELGASAYFVKPFDIYHLSCMVKREIAMKETKDKVSIV